MKILMLTDQGAVFDIFDNCSDITVDGATIFWDSGSAGGVFAVVENSVAIQVGDSLDPALDKKDQFKKKDVWEKMGQVEEQQIQQDLAIADIFEMVIGGGA